MHRDHPLRWTALVGVALLGATLLAPQLAFAGRTELQGPPYFAGQRMTEGLRIVTFTAPEGRIHLRLPYQLKAGETVSGTIELEATDPGRLEALRAYSIDIDGAVTSASADTLVWNVPPSNPLYIGQVALVDPSGSAVVIVEIDICPIEEDPVDPDGSGGVNTPGAVAPAPTRATRGFALPAAAQVGGTLTFSGPFDGDFANTEVWVAGRPAELLAESPHNLVVRNPYDGLGRTSVALREADVEVGGTYCNFDLALAASPPDARPGEKVTLSVVVSGLAGVGYPVPLVVTNRSPEVVRLAGVEGTVLQHRIAPADVDASGGYRLDMPAELLAPGRLLVEARFVESALAHYKNITFAPHVTDYTYHPGPPQKTHVEGITHWEPHVTGVSFSPGGHKKGVTWQPHVAGVTFSNLPHQRGVTWAQHNTGVSFPPSHVQGTTWQPHAAGVTYGVNHVAGVTPPPHLAGYTYNGNGHATGSTWAPHTTGVTFPPTNWHDAATTSYTPHTTGVSWPP